MAPNVIGIPLDKLIPDPPFNTTKPYSPNTMFMIAPYLTGSQRSTALAIAQIVMLADLAVNRALDILDPQ